MLWVVLGLVALFGVLMWIASRRHAHDPHVMPYRTGHTGGLGEAPAGVHHRLGSRRP
ncbi:MAG: hypothetical protein JWO76_3164 [Nocardioides sp.]|nr:hypothetical protein [Nocardioides sp.]